MKKLAVMSDLHLDTNQLTESEIRELTHILLDQGVTDFHIAGDLANDFDKYAQPFLKKCINTLMSATIWATMTC